MGDRRAEGKGQALPARLAQMSRGNKSAPGIHRGLTESGSVHGGLRIGQK